MEDWRTCKFHKRMMFCNLVNVSHSHQTQSSADQTVFSQGIAAGPVLTRHRQVHCRNIQQTLQKFRKKNLQTISRETSSSEIQVRCGGYHQGKYAAEGKITIVIIIMHVLVFNIRTKIFGIKTGQKYQNRYDSVKLHTVANLFHIKNV